ncbi:MAG: alpha/beta hydrolase [Betaproteobacteria bacterium]|nr:alpha/beta hydrolase [Betaproteobacteria bacterium]
MPLATLEGITTNYVVQGAGPHLLMFAPGGFDATVARWSAGGVWKEMDAINALSRHFTVIAYDRRESGSSGGRVERLTWEAYARQAKLLLDHLRVGQAYLVGGCMGASVALAAAARYPAMCRALLLHWPVGGYRWMQKGRGAFNRHMDFVRVNGLAAVAARAASEKKNFWLDPESGPWASVIAADAGFAGQYVKQEVRQYLRIVAASRDALFSDTMPSGATGEELMAMNLPALILPGADASHATSAAWALRELMPMAELWEVLPPHQNGQNVLERMLEFRRAAEQAAQTA